MLKNIRFKKTCLPVGRARAESGQSTVEYIILVTAVIGVIILFMTNQNGLFQQKINNTLIISVNGVESKAVALDSSHTSQGGTVPDSEIQVDIKGNPFNP